VVSSVIWEEKRYGSILQSIGKPSGMLHAAARSIGNAVVIDAVPCPVPAIVANALDAGGIAEITIKDLIDEVGGDRVVGHGWWCGGGLCPRETMMKPPAAVWKQQGARFHDL
jgi:hypothetical protein